MQKWEYETVMISRKRIGDWDVAEWDPKIDLPMLGDNGWELISVVPLADNFSDASVMTNHLVYYFKRPKEYEKDPYKNLVSFAYGQDLS